MAKIDYMSRLRNAGVSCLMSCTCSWCYGNGDLGAAPGIRNSFFGVPVTGTVLGNRPQDQEFHKNIWNAAKKHMREVHGQEVVRNGVGGWKVVQISA
jgi:protein-disulfide isomerase-like protein with CxxC motif